MLGRYKRSSLLCRRVGDEKNKRVLKCFRQNCLDQLDFPRKSASRHQLLHLTKKVFSDIISICGFFIGIRLKWASFDKPEFSYSFPQKCWAVFKKNLKKIDDVTWHPEHHSRPLPKLFVLLEFHFRFRKSSLRLLRVPAGAAPTAGRPTAFTSTTTTVERKKFDKTVVLQWRHRRKTSFLRQPWRLPVLHQRRGNGGWLFRVPGDWIPVQSGSPSRRPGRKEVERVRLVWSVLVLGNSQSCGRWPEWSILWCARRLAAVTANTRLRLKCLTLRGLYCKTFMDVINYVTY